MDIDRGTLRFGFGFQAAVHTVFEPFSLMRPGHYHLITTHKVPEDIQPEGRFIAAKMDDGTYDVFAENAGKEDGTLADKLSLKDVLNMLEWLEEQNPAAQAYIKNKNPEASYCHYTKVRACFESYPHTKYFANTEQGEKRLAEAQAAYTAKHAAPDV